MEIVGVFTTVPLTVTIWSSETIGFLPLLGCSDVVPVAMKFWVSLDIARHDGVFLESNIKRYLRFVSMINTV